MADGRLVPGALILRNAAGRDRGYADVAKVLFDDAQPFGFEFQCSR